MARSLCIIPSPSDLNSRNLKTLYITMKTMLNDAANLKGIVYRYFVESLKPSPNYIM